MDEREHIRVVLTNLSHTVTQRKGRIRIVDFLKKLEYTNKRF